MSLSGRYVLLIFITLGCTIQEASEVPENIKSLENLTTYSASIYNIQPSMEIDLEREVSFDNSDSAFFGAIGGDIVVDERGRVLIADYQRHGIHIFQTNGEYISFIGGEGSGPGEFRSVSSMRIISNTLYVYDGRMMRMTEINLDSLGHFDIKKISPPSRESIEKLTGLSRTGIGKILTRKDGLLLIEFYPLTIVSPSLPGYNLEDKRHSRYYFMNYGGKILSEKLFSLRNRVLIPARVDNGRRFNAGYAYEFLGKPLMAVSDDSHIYTAWTEDFLVRIYGPDGGYQRAFYYPYDRKRLERQEAIKNVMDLGGGDYYLGWVQNIDLPETWPALSYMIVDDENRLWISTVAEDYKLFDWWVLDDHGRLQASFTWPRNRIIELVKKSYLYAREIDGSGGTSIVRFRIKMEKYTD